MPPRIAVLMLVGLTASAGNLASQTVDEKLRLLENQGRVQVEDHTRDACDKSCDLTFTSTTDGDIVVRPSETKYFEIRKDDEWTRWGGYYWQCCGSKGRSRMRGASYIKVVRKADTGAFDQYRVSIRL